MQGRDWDNAQRKSTKHPQVRIPNDTNRKRDPGGPQKIREDRNVPRLEGTAPGLRP